MPHIVAAIASRASADKRTVAKMLRGKAPCSTIWLAVDHAAKALGVTEMPAPLPRQTRRAKPCAECARLRARVAELEAERAASDAALAVALERPAPRLSAVPHPTGPDGGSQ